MTQEETKLEIERLVSDFFKGDKEKIAAWFCAPNPMLGGIVPSAMLYLGREERLLRVVRSLIEGNLP